ncbi:MAG: HTH domain-containing protein [Candidatus Bathyarchaeia archaeon]|jgi:DNA-binding IclR family transcriptional regulator
MSQEIENTILEFLQKECPKDFSIEELAEKTGLHRNTVSKYLFGLEKAGKIKNSRTVGRAKMYTIA